MASFASPSAASKIILARTTWKYGNVYFAARLRSSAVSLGDNTMGYGLSRGILRPSFGHRMPQSKGCGNRIYVSVFMK